jgi:hypothetical protein
MEVIMKYKTNDFTNLLEQPTFNANVILPLAPNRIVQTWGATTDAETDEPESADGFTFVKTANGKRGWIEPFLLTGYVRPEVDETAFVLGCLSAECDTNAADDTDPFYVAAEFVLARAILETKISNTAKRASGPDTFGPLAATVNEWNQFVKEYRNIDEFPASGWDDAISQIWAASYRMRRDARVFSQAATASGAEPVLPTYLDVFHGYLSASPELAAALAKAQADDTKKSLPLKDFLESTLGKERAQDLMTRQPDLYGAATTVAQLNDAATSLLGALLSQASAKIEKASPEQALKPFVPGANPSGGPLGTLIGKGEGGYQSFNRGRAGDSAGQKHDFSQMTVKDVSLAQKSGQFFAIGKYQIIPTTLQGAIDRLRLDTTRLFTDELQELIFRNYLINFKRPDVFRYITGDIVDIKRAQRALALEFASVGEPDSGRSHYGGVGGNQASITLAQSADALNQERALYAEAIARHVTPSDAWIGLSQISDNAAPAPSPPAAPGASGLNIDNAIDVLIRNAQQTSTGLCATYVRKALIAGGLNVSPLPFAKQYLGVLDKKYHFRPISSANYTPAKGDVSVIQPFPGGNPAGHICMYSGAQWISDFKQREMYPGSRYTANRPPYQLYRP